MDGWKLEDVISLWDGICSGAMLVLGMVLPPKTNIFALKLGRNPQANYI